MLVDVHKPVLIDVSELVNNPDNDQLKKPMSAAARDALRASLGSFGMSALLNVAREPGGTHLVLDGNTRVEDLRDWGVPRVWCIVHEDMAHDAPGHLARREEFVLAFDAHRKKFDAKVVKERLESLVTLGRDRLDLDKLLGRRERKKKDADADSSASPEAPSPTKPPETAHSSASGTDDRVEKVKAAVDAAVSRGRASDSIILHGPKDEMDEIRSLLAELRGDAERCSTLLRLCKDAGTRIASDDETFLTALALAFARLIP